MGAFMNNWTVWWLQDIKQTLVKEQDIVSSPQVSSIIDKSEATLINQIKEKTLIFDMWVSWPAKNIHQMRLD